MSQSNWEIHQLDQKYARCVPLRNLSINRQSLEDTLIELAWRAHLGIGNPHSWPGRQTKHNLYTLFYLGVFGQEAF